MYHADKDVLMHVCVPLSMCTLIGLVPNILVKIVSVHIRGSFSNLTHLPWLFASIFQSSDISLVTNIKSATLLTALSTKNNL
jgi:hypothetical protein